MVILFLGRRLSQRPIPSARSKRQPGKMVASLFRPAERSLILSHLLEWQGLKGSGKQRNQDGDLVNIKDELVDSIVLELLQEFPDRDITKSPSGPLVFTQEQRDKLHSVSVLWVVEGGTAHRPLHSAC